MDTFELKIRRTLRPPVPKASNTRLWIALITALITLLAAIIGLLTGLIRIGAIGH